MHQRPLQKSLIFASFLCYVCLCFTNISAQDVAQGENYSELTELFSDWREFERPAMHHGVPDYSASAMAEKHDALRNYFDRLAAIDTTGWLIKQRVDYHIVLAELNGLDFYIRVLKPWVRDPAYYTSIWTYQSDTPAHEGPTNHAAIELWMYDFPLSNASEAKLVAELRTIPPFLEQARVNLTGKARELWIGGIINLRGQANDLTDLAEQTKNSGPELKEAIEAAHTATVSFVSWLEAQSDSKTEPSGLGIEDYTWHLQNIHLVPLTWEEEVELLERELARAHASLKLEEQRNHNLPELVAVKTAEEYEALADKAISDYVSFLKKHNVIKVRDYMIPALQVHKGYFVEEDKRNFFRTAMHFDPTTLYTHFYHWWDHEWIKVKPHASPVRRDALLYNIWDSRAEGMATGVEEMFMHAGLFDHNPRVREIVWILLAQRAARGLGSLYAHANQYTMKEARDFHVKWTPRGWMREDLDLLGFEQLLYMRQPGYGTSYITGKYLIESLMKDRSKQMGDKFTTSHFFEEVNEVGLIPVSLIRWELTGWDDEIAELMGW